jgi:HPt (histidine-containing phosphotransfer) domain-containing protein
MSYSNLAYLRRISQGDHQFMLETLNSFIKQVREVIPLVEQNLISQNWDELNRNIHSLKPGIEIMGIETLKQSILEIETITANNSGAEKLPELIRYLKSVCETVALELNLEKSKFSPEA